MNKVILDLEFCGLPKKLTQEYELCKHEIIQVGAVLLNEENEIISSFDQLIKPQYSSITSEISELTHISDETVKDAAVFSEVMDAFFEWAGDEAEFYSWSMIDLQILTEERSLKRYKNQKLDQAVKHWFDLQQIVDDMLHLSKNLALEKALSACDIAFVGQQHSACDDARNTARLYQIMQNPEEFRKRMQPLIDFMTPKEDVTTSMGSLFSKLKISPAE